MVCSLNDPWQTISCETLTSSGLVDWTKRFVNAGRL